MAHELRLYTDLTRNYDDHVHLFVTNTNLNYFLNTYIETNRLATLTLDNYRINLDTAKCNITDTLTLNNFQSVTMLADVEEVNGAITFLRFYRVTSSYVQSGYIIFKIEVDLWQTYIHKCAPALHTIFRSNRVLNGGFYEEIKMTDGRMQYELYDGQASLAPIAHYKSNAVWLVFLLEYNVAQAFMGDDRITKTELYGASLATIANAANRSEGSLGEYKTDLEIALAIIGGIYGVKTNNIASPNDAQVLKAWIIPHNEIEDANYGVTIVSKSMFNNITAGTIQDAEVNVAKIMPSKWHNQHIIDDYDPNRVYYAGTINNGLKLRNYAGKTLTYYTHVYVGDSDIKVIAQQGERQQDITQGYEVKLTTNGAQKTEIRKLADAFSNAFNFGQHTIGNAAKGFAMGGYAGAAINAVMGVAADILPLVNQFGIESARGSGDGFLTYYQTNPLDEVLSPYCVTYFESIRNEVLNAEVNGLIYDSLHYEELLNNFFIDEELITEGIVDYLQAHVECSNAPREAIDFIESEFLRGIYIDVVTPPTP